MRPILLALASVLSLLTLSACQAERVGRLAAAVNADGEPVLVMASCEGPPYAIEVTETPLGQPDPFEQVWEPTLELDNADPRFDDPAAISLVNPGERWTVTERSSDFEDGMLYEVWAWPAGDENLGSVQFDLERLAALGEGEVLYQDNGADHVVPVDEFMDLALGECPFF
jgi:hypothetical protein